MKHGKKYIESAKLIESSKLYDPDEAVKLALQTAKTKFDETMEISVRLGVDPRQPISRSAALSCCRTAPARRFASSCSPRASRPRPAEEAGADYVGAEELVAKIQGENWFDFDVVVATPNMMGVVGRLGRRPRPEGPHAEPEERHRHHGCGEGHQRDQGW